MRGETPIDKYITEHITPESEHLYNLYRATNIELVNPQMASGHIQGRLLKMLVEMINPENILEIGTFTGYSAICMAEGLSENGRIYTFDTDDEKEDFTRKWINGSNVADKIFFKIGDALKEVPKLNIKFDLVFIDGDKREYVEYYKMAMNLLNERGWIIADNTLWDGHVTEPERTDAQTEGIRRFNDFVRDDKHTEKVILPLRDGLTIIRKLT